jgi:hypothetical protein
MNKIDLKCEICNSKFDVNYNIPKVLSCGHTVCAKCVDRMKDKAINKCPFDRKILDFDDDKIACNYYILSLIDNSVNHHRETIITEEEEVFSLQPKPVINSPGWKNTLDGFIKNDVLYSVETNGFIYCTDLNTGEWWFMYHNQFFGNYFFQEGEKMFLIDQYGSLFQIFTKNYYVQIGKKNSWRNTSHLTVFDGKIYSLETTNKFYETNLSNGKWREIMIVGNENNNILNIENEEDIQSRMFKNANMVIANGKNILLANKSGEVYSFNPLLGETKMIKTNSGFKNVESYASNSTHVYFFEKNSKIIYRASILPNTEGGVASKTVNSKNLLQIPENKSVTNSHSSNRTPSNNTLPYINPSTFNLCEKYENDLKKEAEGSSSKRFSGFLEVEVFLDLENVKVIPGNGCNALFRKHESETEIKIQNNQNNENITSTSIIPLKIICDDKRVVIIDKKGEINTISLNEDKSIKCFQCLFMLRNCHLQNTALIGDGDLLLLDPIRLSLNKLNIIQGTEVIVLHSTKFLYQIKNIFSSNSRIYFIDIQGNLYYFNESDKKLTQIGNNGICKYIVDFAVYKNFILTLENNTLYRTNLNDGNYIEIKNEFCKNYEFFFADNMNIIFVNKDDSISVLNMTTTSNNNMSSNNKENISSNILNNNVQTNLNANSGVCSDYLKLKKTFKIDKISKMSAVCYFRNNIIFYNKQRKTIESVNIEDEKHLTMVENFPDVNMFINNNDFLACILRDGVIYKLYC